MLETTFTGPDLTFPGSGHPEVDRDRLVSAPKERGDQVPCRMPAGFKAPFCKTYGAQGQARGTVALRLAYEPPLSIADE